MKLDASGAVLGRAAAYIAKQALLGEQIDIFNCEKAIIIGDKKNIISKYKQRRARGTPVEGPFFPKTPERIFRRTIRGMLPYKKTMGKAAFRRIKCYIGEGKEAIPLEQFKKTARHLTLRQLCDLM